MIKNLTTANPEKPEKIISLVFSLVKSGQGEILISQSQSSPYSAIDLVSAFSKLNL